MPNVNIDLEIVDVHANTRETKVPEETPEGFMEVPATEYDLVVKVRVKVTKGFIPILSSGKLYLNLVTSRTKSLYDKGVRTLDDFKDFADIKEDITVPYEGEFELREVFAVEHGYKPPKYYVGAYAEVGYLGQSEIVWKEVVKYA